MYCKYYQAHVLRHKAWFFVGALRSFDHLVFERTYDKEKSIFEFFVPNQLEKYFLDLIAYFQEKNIVTEFVELPNRFLQENK
jgi:hypothetical protein